MAEERFTFTPRLAKGSWSRIWWYLFYAIGMIACLLVYGVLQERIMTIEYGSRATAEMFSYSVFCILINRILAVIFAVVMCFYKRESLRWKAPLWTYLIISLSNTYASACQYEALRYVTFAIQQLAKSIKMIPVMIWARIISDKRYDMMDWIVAVCVTGGVFEFCLTGPVSTEGGEHATQFRGFLFIFGYLALDGLTSTTQEKLFKDYRTSTYNQMLYVNLFSAIISLITLLATGTFAPAFSFAGRHVLLLGDTLVLAIAQVGSQYFIYAMVKDFGALVFAATLNVRQVSSVVVSYITFNHHITGLQFIGLIIAFGPLLYRSYTALVEGPDTKEEQAPLTPPPLSESHIRTPTPPVSRRDDERFP